ncbi:hypothetical protein OSB04_004844 [Centaurea solstitialis]|uniref:Avr9/Cf-9 rapidly elicited protein 146 n=1 Tax=Centaurea solstitialis TaxID=347529 RepID=A0AA38WR39_9ASTR|nr:hypothetical protein OSB04_004844 [Centaurea solstitialis]
MEQNLPIMAKKVWNLMRVFFFILKKGISKTKFLADLNLIIKRGKLAGKALHNLLFHHHHHWAAAATIHRPPPPEFTYTYISTHKKHHHPSAAAAGSPAADGGDGIVVTPAVMKALEMLASAAASPAAGFRGFGKGSTTPRVRELRITDSPFPLSNGDEDGKVDEAAEKFITRFYNDLRRQN